MLTTKTLDTPAILVATFPMKYTTTLLVPFLICDPPGNPVKKYPLPKKYPAFTLPATVRTFDDFSKVSPVLPARTPASLNITCVSSPAALATTRVCPALKNLTSTNGSVGPKLLVKVITLPETL